jgi:GNAT superfamily N-acetyltransferase
MFHIQTFSHLVAPLRFQVDQLIHHVWTTEASQSSDVEVLVKAGTNVVDPLDAMSTHVVVRGENSQIIGYGRVTIASNSTQFHSMIQETELEAPAYPVACISRLVVHPDYRNQGIATAIHKTRIEIAKANGAAAIYGWAVGNKPRHSLASIGFNESKLRHGCTNTWYQTTRDTRLVRLALATESFQTVERRAMSSHY